MKQFDIKYTDNYEELKELFIKNGLEAGNEPVPTEMIKCWKVTLEDNGREIMVGGATLGLRAGEYVVDGIAIEPQYRDCDIGTEMLEKLVDYAKEIGVKKLWLVAIAPGFFKKNGFTAVERDDAPYIFGCFNCEKYGKECKPEVMRMDLWIWLQKEGGFYEKKR